MSDRTRAVALAEARASYRAFVDRARPVMVAPDGFVDELAARWDAVLVRLGTLGEHIVITREVGAALDFLASQLDGDALDPDEALHWLDAFPESVADLFPPSAATYQLVDDHGAVPETWPLVKRRAIARAA